MAARPLPLVIWLKAALALTLLLTRLLEPPKLAGSQLASGGHMKNIQEVLQQKEARMQQLRTEIEALRVVAPLLGSGEPAAAGNVTVIPSPARQDDKVDLSSFLTDVNS